MSQVLPLPSLQKDCVTQLLDSGDLLFPISRERGEGRGQNSAAPSRFDPAHREEERIYASSFIPPHMPIIRINLIKILHSPETTPSYYLLHNM